MSVIDIYEFLTIGMYMIKYSWQRTMCAGLKFVDSIPY